MVASGRFTHGASFTARIQPRGSTGQRPERTSRPASPRPTTSSQRGWPAPATAATSSTRRSRMSALGSADIESASVPAHPATWTQDFRAAQRTHAAVQQSPTHERLPVPHLTKALAHDRSPRASVTAAIAMAACTHRRSRASWHGSLLEAATRGHDRSRRCRQGTRQGSARRSATPLCRSTPVGVRRGAVAAPMGERRAGWAVGGVKAA